LLLSTATQSGGALDLTVDAAVLALDSPLVQTIAPLGRAFYQVGSDVGGRLTVQLRASGFPARLSLVDSQGHPLTQSDGAATGGVAIDVSVPPGVNFLEVQSLGSKGSFQVLASLVPSAAPFETVPSMFSGLYQLAEGSFFGDGVADLVAPDGIHLGNGDGTFQNNVVDGPLGDPGWTVTAIAAGNFSNNPNLPDIAFTETSPDGSTSYLRVLQNEGAGQFKMGAPFAVGPQPVGIQTIDFGNGIVDLAVADLGTGNVAIFNGDGTGVFAPGQVFCGGDQPSAIVSGRFGDGSVDLIVADMGDSDTGQGAGLTVFQADKSGLFQLSGTIGLDSAPSALVAGDFTGDGVLDLAVAELDSDSVSVLLNNGNGTFLAPRSYAVGTLPLALVAGDFGNGHVDLATANFSSNDLSVLLGNGDGTFQTQIRFGTGVNPVSLVACDLNADQRTDLAVADLGSGAGGDITVLLGRGDGTFQDQLANPVGDDPLAAVTADLSHDGHVDVITADQYSNDISVLMGNGDGTFEAARSFYAGAGPTALVVGDWNGDGRLDVAVTDSGDSNRQGQGVSILLGNGDGTFLPPIFYPAGTYPSSIAAGDFTGNGILDLAVANQGSNDVSILLGNGDGSFTVLPPIKLQSSVSGPISITDGDFGNGEIDLALANLGTDNVSILLGDGRGGFQVLPPISLGTDPRNLPRAIVAVDLTGDGKLDLAIASTNSSEEDTVSILVGQGQGQFNPLPEPVSLGTGVDPTSITAGPFFGDGQLGLAITESNADAVSLIENNGPAGFQVVQTLQLDTGGAPISIAAGDFTGNGMTDLAIATQSPNSVAIALNQGKGQFVQPGSVGLATHNTPLVADLNGDGLPDVAIVDGAGDILFRPGEPGAPGTFGPPVTVNPPEPGQTVPQFPSRDIAAVVTRDGTFLASVDANDNAVTLFAYSDGTWSRSSKGPLATGIAPAQIVSADLLGNGDDDLVIRNAGDGTLTVYMSDGHGGFLPPISLAVGPGISDVSVADLSQDGLLDILLANQAAGEVEVIMNQGTAGFSPPVLYRAGTGSSALIGGTGTPPVSVFSEEGTVGVAATAFSKSAPPDLVAANAGSETIGVLQGLGDERFANPISLPTIGPAVAVRVADFNQDGISDLAILGPDGLSIWFANGKGGFNLSATYDVGPDPTGLTIADVNGDNIPDIVVGNAFGDVLVLLGEANGSFQQPTPTDKSVGLQVGYLTGQVGPTLIYVDQAKDRIVVQDGPKGKATVLADRSTGLLVPGAPVLADLNGNGMKDLIVPNGGGNNVLVYPGLPGGGFGPPLNNGNGFFAGTNPVSVVVADVNRDGRPDLIVVDKGSNEVSILVNDSTPEAITFATPRRYDAGAGPVSVLYGDFSRNGIPDLLVSDSGSNQLMLLPGLGGGFFNDAAPTIIPLTESPGPIFAGPFEGGDSLDVVALNPGTASVTLISGLATAAPRAESFDSGGFDPVAAFELLGSNGFEDLVVANNFDGHVALLEGDPGGLTLAEVNTSLHGLNPTGLAFASIQNNDLSLYGAVAGQETVSLLVFSLNSASPASAGPGLSVLSSQGFSPLLVATIGYNEGDLNASASESGGPAGGAAAVVGASGTTAASLGQGPIGNELESDQDADHDELVNEAETGPEAKSDHSVWKRVMIGLDEAFEGFRRAMQPKPEPKHDSGRPDERAPNDCDPPSDGFEAFNPIQRTDRLRTIDAAIDAFSEASDTIPATPIAGRSAAPATSHVRFEPLWLTWAAVACVPSGSLNLASARPSRCCRSPGGITGRRRKGGRSPRSILKSE
jgi:hypothetical protein